MGAERTIRKCRNVLMDRSKDSGGDCREKGPLSAFIY